MPRKFINRTRRDSSDVSAEDEWAHITDIVEGPTLEIKDAMDTQERNIIFSKNQEPKTTFEKVKEGTRNAMDAAGNTGQYIKFVNEHIDKQKKEIDKIKKIKEKFDQEVELLQSHNPNLLKLDVDSLENFDIKTVSKYLQQLLQEKGFTKEKLNNLKDVINNVEDELENQENQIQGLNQELDSKQFEEQVNGKSSETIKTELNLLAEKFGINNLSDVFDAVKSAKSSSNEK
jgi:flagellar biosynthesis chaperone FliJ